MPLLDPLDLRCADIRDVLPTLADSSVDLVLADPPYAVGATRAQLHGPDWDSHGSVAFDPEFWSEIHRVCVPGATVLCFGDVTTIHRAATAIENSGLRIVDQLAWLKSHAGRTGDREIRRELHDLGAEPELAEDYRGWHRQLRQSWEPIVVARRLDSGQSLGRAVAEGGAGGWHVDAVRIPDGGEDRSRKPGVVRDHHLVRVQHHGVWSEPHPGGRQPTNVVFEHEPGCTDTDCEPDCVALAIDAGGRQKYRAGRERASRFFSRVRYSGRAATTGHPTAKPDAVAEWLATLTVRPGATVLDPFAGSGSLALAAARAGARTVVAVEREAEYVEIISRRFAESDAKPPAR